LDAADPLAPAPPAGRACYPLAGCLAAVVLAVALNCGLVFDPASQTKWSTSPDSVSITRQALEADTARVLSWWHGPWVEGEMYYRPLSSMLMWAEARLWGYHFLPYTLVSLTLHALNSALVVLLLYSVCPGPRWQRALIGLAGALCFNLGHHPAGPFWIYARVAWGTMIWWPVQTDFASLLCSLLSLLLLDRTLVSWQVSRGAAPARPDPRLLSGALAAFLAALLFKETPLVLIGIVPFLCLYRWRPWVKVTACYAALGLLLLALRAVFVPAASNPEWLGAYTFYKLLSWVHLLSAELLANGEIWEFVAVAGGLALVFGLRRLKVPALYVVLACLAWPFLIAAWLAADHNPMLATIPREMLIQLRYIGVLGGFLAALLTAGSEPALVFIIGLFAVAAANVNRVGPHYWYYPAAMWGLVDAAVLNAAINLARNWLARARQQQLVEATTATPASSES
jgi:hypothetical protein